MGMLKVAAHVVLGSVVIEEIPALTWKDGSLAKQEGCLFFVFFPSHSGGKTVGPKRLNNQL